MLILQHMQQSSAATASGKILHPLQDSLKNIKITIQILRTVEEEEQSLAKSHEACICRIKEYIGLLILKRLSEFNSMAHKKTWKSSWKIKINNPVANLDKNAEITIN